jgi:hypothetical protein
MSWLIRDLRYGLRESLRRPGFTALAILTLALGIRVRDGDVQRDLQRLTEALSI